MPIIGCDFHTPYQQIGMANDESGELLLERRLTGGPGTRPHRYLGATCRIVDPRAF